MNDSKETPKRVEPSAATPLLAGDPQPYTTESDGIPMSGDPVGHIEAIEAFCKVVRYWSDHSDMDHIRCRAETPAGNIGEFIQEGLEFLWHFVVMPDRDESGKIDRTPATG